MDQEQREGRARLAYHRSQGGMNTTQVARSMGVTPATAKRLIAQGKALADGSATDQVVALREEEHLSWKRIADEMGLGTPATARRRYRQATGFTGPLERLPGKGGRVAVDA